MKWPWSKRNRSNRHHAAEARSDLADGQRRLEEAHAVDPVVRTLVRKLVTRREENNFAAMIEAAFREHR